jgi:hypothetical protein
VKGTESIIATWSDRDFVEEIDFEEAVRRIRYGPTDPDDERPIPDDLYSVTIFFAGPSA